MCTNLLCTRYSHPFEARSHSKRKINKPSRQWQTAANSELVRYPLLDSINLYGFVFRLPYSNGKTGGNYLGIHGGCPCRASWFLLSSIYPSPWDSWANWSGPHDAMLMVSFLSVGRREGLTVLSCLCFVHYFPPFCMCVCVCSTVRLLWSLILRNLIDCWMMTLLVHRRRLSQV